MKKDKLDRLSNNLWRLYREGLANSLQKKMEVVTSLGGTVSFSSDCVTIELNGLIGKSDKPEL